MYEHAFRYCPSLRLENLTVNDIRKYVSDKIEVRLRTTQLAWEDPALVAQLVGDIVKMSSGVFLWVSLAVRSLLTGLTNFDQISDLQQRLRELPLELDSLYNVMLRNNRLMFYLEQASKLFQITRLPDQDMSTLALSFADDKIKDPGLVAPQERLSLESRLSRVTRMMGRIHNRCADLLEVLPSFPHFSPYNPSDRNLKVPFIRPGFELSSPYDTGDHISKVQFLHLTVKEWMETPDLWTQLINHTVGADFNASVSMLKSVTIELSPHNSRWAEIRDLQPHVSALVNRGMEYAWRAKNGTGVAQVTLLDELDRNVQRLFANPTANSRFHTSEQLHWTSNHHPGYDYHHSFLVFAVSCGLTRYVKAKLKQSASKINMEAHLPLVEYATTYRPEKWCSEQPAMVEMLLEAGMNPNERRHRTSPWQKVLGRLSKAVHNKTDLDPSWLHICKLLVMYDATINSSVVELIHATFFHLPQDSVYEIQNMHDEIVRRSRGKRTRSGKWTGAAKISSLTSFTNSAYRSRV